MIKLSSMVMQWSKQVFNNGLVPVTVYRSRRSRLSLVVGDIPGPMIKGTFSFVTEAETDDGLPHTLEHLVFMGSERFPFKGVLDIVANRCLASGTNAWTDQDHTAYTLSTVGEEGFLKVLPVYLDHLLGPTLTECQFLTEVHHINADGEDGGVVYSEMQDHESEMESLVTNKRKELMYPFGCSYRTDTGGRLVNLRSSCTIDKVRAYHKAYYHLSNLNLTVCGTIDHEKLLSVIGSVEDCYLERAPKSFPRPFQSKIAPLNGNLLAKINCPAEDATRGNVTIAWRGPKATEHYTDMALHVLFDYLEKTAVSPLQADFVQLMEPFCSGVSFNYNEQTISEIVLEFEGVPIEKLDLIEPRLFDVTMARHASEDSFDMQRMGWVIDNQRRKCFSQLESNPHDTVFTAAISHQLFDENEKQLEERLAQVDTLRRLKQEPESFWKDLVVNYLVQNHSTVIAVPDVDLAERIAQEEEDRIEKQCSELGDAGLAKCADTLCNAIETNTKDKPREDQLADLIVRQLGTVAAFGMKTMQWDNTTDRLPFTAFIHECQSKFIEVNIVFDTVNLSIDQRRWLMLWTELLFESPTKLDGQPLSYTQLAALLTRDLVSYSAEVGIYGFYNRMLTVKLKVEMDDVKKVKQWAKALLTDIQWDPERISICAQKLLSQAVEEKRDGSTVCGALLRATIYRPDSNSNVFGLLPLEKFHEEVVKQVQTDPNGVVRQLETMKTAILNCPVNLHFACDDSQGQLVFDDEPWFINVRDARRLSRTPHQCSSDDGLNQLDQQRLIVFGASESAFLRQVCLYEGGYTRPDLAATLLLAQYMSQCEGPLWTAVRGEGLAYGANIYVQVDQALISLNLYRCAQLGQAYKRAKAVMEEITGDTGLNEALFEAAKRSLCFELLEGEETLKSTIKQAVLAPFRGLGLDFVRQLCARIWQLSMEETSNAANPVIRRLFDEASIARAVVVHPSREAETRQLFPKMQLVPLESLALKNVTL